jgi:hypothetical protein
MAIIRKGDKKAELKLRVRAVEQSENRRKASDDRKVKAGLEFKNKSNTSITGDPSKIKVTKDKSGKTSATYRDEPFTGPISGSAVANKVTRDKKNKQNLGSGVIKAGKVVKGSHTMKSNFKSSRGK